MPFRLNKSPPTIINHLSSEPAGLGAASVQNLSPRRGEARPGRATRTEGQLFAALITVLVFVLLVKVHRRGGRRRPGSIRWNNRDLFARTFS